MPRLDGQETWMIQEFASFVTSSGLHGPGSIPPSTVGSRSTTLPPATAAR